VVVGDTGLEFLETGCDAELIETAKQPTDEAHPGRYSETELRILVSTTAFNSERAASA
jgi:hypothetical protein